MQVWPRASERGRHNGSAARRKGPADGMKGRASGPASRSGFSAASSAVRHEASSASRRTFSFAARTGAFLPVRAALFSRPCRNALPVGRCLPAGVCPCGAPGRDALFPPLPFRGGRPFSRKGTWGKSPLPSSLPWESGRHAPAGRRAAGLCTGASGPGGARRFFRGSSMAGARKRAGLYPVDCGEP